MREFDPEHEALRTEIERGAVGRPMLIRCTHANVGAGVPPVDAFIRSAVHDLHTLRFLTDQEIQEVMVHTIAAEEDVGLIRLATITCRMDSALGTVALNLASAYGYDVQVEATGESGIVRTKTRGPRQFITSGTEDRSVSADWLDWFQTAYRREMQAWIASLSSPQAVGPSTWDGYATVAAATACIESARIGRPVQVELIPRPIAS